MSRLIDADYFKEQIVAVTLKNNLDTDKAMPLLELIDTQPTAFDIEKVVAELEEWTFNADINIGDGTIMNHNLITSKNAIDIVRKGGVK